MIIHKNKNRHARLIKTYISYALTFHLLKEPLLFCFFCSSGSQRRRTHLSSPPLPYLPCFVSSCPVSTFFEPLTALLSELNHGIDQLVSQRN